MATDPVSLEIFRNLFTSLAEEMGIALGRTAFSPNIKERLDYSCGLFDANGRMVAQAAHIPVHLGSMPASVEAALNSFSFKPGDIVMLNDPYMGGTHLPDITLVAPVFSVADEAAVLVGFVANRGHHADIGGMNPGSLPISTQLFQEGLIIPPIKLVKRGRINQEVVEVLCRNSRTPDERRGDLAAQLAACRVGERRLKEIVSRYGWEDTLEHMSALLDYSERLTRSSISGIPDGWYVGSDYLEDDGLTEDPLLIQVAVRIRGDEMDVDFNGTASQTAGCVNAPLAIALSSVFYVLRCIVGEQVPANDGVMRPVTVKAPENSLVNPAAPHAVSGGNVETSQRIVDVLLTALSKALPSVIPAASQGTMNNLLVGGHNHLQNKSYAYYETIGGGMGARPGKNGLSGIHTHMTNTMNTPIEALELQFPFRILRYLLRPNSGGKGAYRGGDGIVREMEFLGPATVTILSECRRRAPYGLHGGEPGALGQNVLFRDGEEILLPAKVTFQADEGDILSMRTPGGGGWGRDA